MKTNKTVDAMLNHMSIRKWKDEPVDPEILETLYKVANRTSTAIGMQTASIIRVTDMEKRRQIAEVTTQKYVEEAPEFWIFILDNFKAKKVLEEEGITEDKATGVDRFLSSISDALLMTQNVANAIESFGLGFTIFGSIQNDIERIIEILDLPKYTMPIVGLGFGTPDQNPGLKPRMDYDLKIFENTYKVLDDYHEAFEDYDKVLQTYYDLRDKTRPVDSYTKQIKDKFTKANPKRQVYFDVARKQGFDI